MDIIEKNILWNRLIALVEEQAQVLQRTAFSPIVRESGDLAAGVFDASGNMLAQALTGTPGHINSMALTVGHVIDKIGCENIHDGDVYLTNDPWMGTGHTNDFSVTTPIFHKSKLVGFMSCNSHLIDIGGLNGEMTSTDVFMEGLYLPILKVVDKGRIVDQVIEIIRANSRLPDDSVGDTFALISCNDVGAKRVIDVLNQGRLEDLSQLSDHILTVSRNALEREIAKLPKGSWTASLPIDGVADAIEIHAKLTIADREIVVDFEGTSGMVRGNTNVPLCYALAYTSYAVRCIVGKAIPNNAGSLAPIRIVAPEGSIVNATKPAAVIYRHAIGLMLPDVVFGCLRQVLPDVTPCEGAGPLWMINVAGQKTLADGTRQPYRTNLVTAGGMGALPYRNGLSATAYPSGVRAGSVEIFEAITGLTVWQKRLRKESGGAGRFRGGDGQVIEISSEENEAFTFKGAYERCDYPARGYCGGENGAAGRVYLRGGAELGGRCVVTVAPGSSLMLESPGGGGWGPKE